MEETTGVDANILNIFKKPSTSTDTKKDVPDAKISKDDITEIDKDADCYDMNHYERGIAIIFNHYEFDSDNAPREGTNKDCEDISEVLKMLKFDVKAHHDLKYGEISDVLDDVAALNHSKYDCLVVVVMTHGDVGTLHAKDHKYPPDVLWKSFAGNKCPTLAGKPKLFFIQACRGTETDSGVKVRSRTATDHSKSYKIPSMADILVMFSSYDNHFSFRSSTRGSWFIQSLCKELKERANKNDLLTILTYVNRNVAINYESFVPNNKNLHEKKQVGVIMSTLTRLVYFF